jgi:hypothetical protein
LAFIVAAIYAFVSYRQWTEMQKQPVNASRAWLGYQQVKDSNLPIIVDHVAISPRLTVEAHYTIENFGSGPAVKVSSIFWVETGKDLAMLKRTAAFICTSSVKFATGTVPVSPAVYNAHSETWGGDAMPSLQWMYVMGCVAYLDQFKTWHWTRYCIVIGDGKKPITDASPKRLYTLFNDTDETGEQHPYE